MVTAQVMRPGASEQEQFATIPLAEAWVRQRLAAGFLVGQVTGGILITAPDPSVWKPLPPWVLA